MERYRVTAIGLAVLVCGLPRSAVPHHGSPPVTARDGGSPAGRSQAVAEGVAFEPVAMHGGTVWAVAALDGMAHAGGLDGVTSRVVAWDLTDRAGPRRVGASTAQEGRIAAIAVRDGQVILASNPAGGIESDPWTFFGLKLLSLVEPGGMVEVASRSLQSGEHPTDLDPVGDLVYATRDSFVELYRIVDRGELAAEGSFRIGDRARPAAGPRDLFVARCERDRGTDALVLDVAAAPPSRPVVPAERASEPVPLGNVGDIAAWGDRAYVVGSDFDLWVVDVAEARRPGTEARWAERSVVLGGRAYVLGFMAGLRAFDLRSPADPPLLGWLELDGHALAAWDDVLYVGTRAKGGSLQLVAAGDPAALGTRAPRASGRSLHPARPPPSTSVTWSSPRGTAGC